MDARVTHFSLIMDFPNDALNIKDLSEKFKIMVDDMFSFINVTCPDDWVLIYQATYTNSQSPLVSKNTIGSFPSDKMKYITIVIPIPIKSEIEWGISPDQHLYRRDHYDGLMRNFNVLNIDYTIFNNCKDYIEACISAGIYMSFEKGFTIGGTKIKANSKKNI